MNRYVYIKYVIQYMKDHPLQQYVISYNYSFLSQVLTRLCTFTVSSTTLESNAR